MEAHASFGDLEGLGFGLLTLDETGRVVSCLGSAVELLGADVSEETAESLGLGSEACLRPVNGRIIEVKPVSGSEGSCWLVADVTARVEAERRAEEASWRLELALRKTELERFLADAREVLHRDGDVYSAVAAIARVEAGAQALGLEAVVAAARAALEEGDLDRAACEAVAQSLDAFEADHGEALSLGSAPPNPLVTLEQVFQTMAERLGRKLDLSVEGEPAGALSPILACVPPLLENAVVHGHPDPSEDVGGQVSVRFGEEGAFSFVTVVDDGHGMDLAALTRRALQGGRVAQEHVERLQPHERLALAFLDGSLGRVKQLTDAARGHIEIRTGPGRGTQVTLKVPTAA